MSISDDPISSVAPAGDQASSKPDDPSRVFGVQIDVWFELWLVLLIAVIPYIIGAIRDFVAPSRTSDGFAYQSLMAIVDSAGTIALIMFIVSRSGEGASVFGLVRLRKIKDAAIGVGVW